MCNLPVNGGFISESFSRWPKSPPKSANNYPESYPPKEKMLRNQDSDLPTFLGDLSQNEKFSEIMPTVVHRICEIGATFEKVFGSLTSD